jgi:hypothetical protein
MALHPTRRQTIPGGRAYAWKPGERRTWRDQYGNRFIRHPRAGAVRVLIDQTVDDVRRVVWRRTGRV